jgi:hypothetical protein
VARENLSHKGGYERDSYHRPRPHARRTATSRRPPCFAAAAPRSPASALMRSQGLHVLWAYEPGAAATSRRPHGPARVVRPRPRGLLAPLDTRHATRRSRPATPPRRIHAAVTVAPPGRCSLRAVRYSRRPRRPAARWWPTPRPGRAVHGHSRESGLPRGRSGRGRAHPARWAGADPPAALPGPAG